MGKGRVSIAVVSALIAALTTLGFASAPDAQFALLVSLGFLAVLCMAGALATGPGTSAREFVSILSGAVPGPKPKDGSILSVLFAFTLVFAVSLGAGLFLRANV